MADNDSRSGLFARVARLLRRERDEPATSATTLFTASGTGRGQPVTGEAAPPPSPAPSAPAASRPVEDRWALPPEPTDPPDPEAPLFSEARLREVEEPLPHEREAADPAPPPPTQPAPPPAVWDDDAAELSMLTAELRAFADGPDEPVEAVTTDEQPAAHEEPAPFEATVLPEGPDVHDEPGVLDEPAATEVPTAPSVPEPSRHAEGHDEADALTETGQRIRVHGERIDTRPGPIQLSPSEAIALAKDGPEALHRRTGR